MKALFRSLCGVLALLLLFLTFPISDAATKTAENDLSARCSYTASAKLGRNYKNRLHDGDVTTHVRLKAEDGVIPFLTISWDADVPVTTIFYELYALPDSFTLTLTDADGNILEERAGDPTYYNDIVELPSGARSLRLSSSAELDIATLAALGEGELPHDYHAWEPTPDKLDYLVISMHPDDDVLFFGGVVPTYTAERGLTGDIVYLATRERLRCSEALNGAWTLGLRCYPIFAGFPDIPNTQPEDVKATYNKDELCLYLVRLFRRLKPEVVVTHDLNGEYGHWQHKLTAATVLEAMPLAADASYDAESTKQWGVYEVKKLYLHLYAENPFVLNVTTPLEAFDGATAVDVARAAYLEHASQYVVGHRYVTNEGVDSLENYGLAYTTVGLDSGSGDMFENVPIQLLSTYVAPTPSPTSEQTPPSTPAPTKEPVAEVFAAATQAPTATATAVADAEGTKTVQPWLFVGAALLAALIAGSLLILFGRKRHAK